MTSAKTGKQIMDPILLMAMKFRAKCRFRAYARLVMANAYWLIEDVDHYEGDDVKRRVQQAVQRSTKGKKQLLSIKDKAILNIPAQDRTETEKRYLYRLIGNLKCFKRYPSHVKRKLAAVTYFKYYGPGRIIVKEEQEAYAMYFLISGSMVVTRMEFDEILQKHIPLELGTMNAGDIFGEVSLLHSVPRTATVTTTGHCEVLQLMKEDFKNILQVSVQQQWDEVRSAMKKFTYFECLDERALSEGCIVAKIKNFEPNETILGDGQGVPNHVYFVLSGRCQMIESLKVIVKTRLGKTFYTLYDPYVPPEEVEEDFQKKWITNYKPRTRSSDVEYLAPVMAQESSIITADSDVKKKVSRIEGSILKGRNESQSTSGIFKRTSFHVDKPAAQKLDSITESGNCSTILDPTDDPDRRQSHRVTPPTAPLINAKTYYMQVCQYNVGASFGFGENMRDRRILALTPTQCLLLPKIWLLQRNTANIWTRIEYYLEKKIPTKDKLFKDFISQRRWEEYRTMLVDDVMRNIKTVNYTCVHDVPYSIRMEELHDA